MLLREILYQKPLSLEILVIIAGHITAKNQICIIKNTKKSRKRESARIGIKANNILAFQY